MLYTVAYPSLSSVDRRFIDAFRHEYDVPYRDVIAPHFTLVFGCSDVDEASYLYHVEEVARESLRFEFCCRYAMLGDDAEEETAYVFLVPDEGFSVVSLLHDRLYSGLLKPLLRLDVPFIPHITIGTLPDAAEAKALCDDLNSAGVFIQGSVDAITVGSLEGPRFHDMANYELPEA